METSASDGKPKERGQHPKHHGVVVAKFAVPDDLPMDLRLGVFREPQTYTAIVCFSNGDAKDDTLPNIHGMAIKLLGVDGEKLLEIEKDAKTQDFVLMDYPIFFSKDVDNLLAYAKAMAALSTDKDLLTRLSSLTPEEQAAERERAFAEMRPQEAKILAAINSKPPQPSPLVMDYYSTTAYSLGCLAVKYRAMPEQNEASIRGKMDGMDYLREAMVEQLTVNRQAATFGFYIQRQGDPESMPIEDPTVEWTAPWERVATIEINAQQFDFPERTSWGNLLSYTPWHSLKEHRPLGGINRARKEVYSASSQLRHKNLGTSKEPVEADIPTGNTIRFGKAKVLSPSFLTPDDPIAVNISPDGLATTVLFGSKLDVLLRAEMGENSITQFAVIEIPVMIPEPSEETFLGYHGHINGTVQKGEGTRVTLTLDLGGTHHFVEYPFGKDFDGTITPESYFSYSQPQVKQVEGPNGERTVVVIPSPSRYSTAIIVSIQRRTPQDEASVLVEDLAVEIIRPQKGPKG